MNPPDMNAALHLSQTQVRNKSTSSHFITREQNTQMSFLQDKKANVLLLFIPIIISIRSSLLRANLLLSSRLRAAVRVRF